MEVDPKRWLDGSDAPDDLLEALGDLERERPTAAELAQLIEAMPAGPPSGPGGAGGLGSPGTGLSTLTWVAVVVATAAGIALLASWHASPVDDATPVEVRPAARVDVTRAAPAANLADEPEGASSLEANEAAAASIRETAEHGDSPARPRPRTPSPGIARAPEASDPALGSGAQAPPGDPEVTPAADGPSEASLLISARRALGHSPARALELTREHQRLFPAGALAEEREVVAIEALFRLGRGAEAHRRAEGFLNAHPSSIHRSTLESLVAEY